MPPSFDTLEAQALQLTAEERAQLADHLLASLGGASETDDAWFAEVQQRIAEIEQRGTPMVPVGDAIARARQALA